MNKEQDYTKSMIMVCIIIIAFHTISAKLFLELEKTEFCRTLHCDETVDEKVCGIRRENGKNTYKLFDNECLLLKYGCQVDDVDAYGTISKQRCYDYTTEQNAKSNCSNCQSMKKDFVCGIRQDGNGYRVKIFQNKCELDKYNCEENLQFRVTDLIICLFHKSNHTIEGFDEITDLPKQDYIDKKNDDILSYTQEIDATVEESTNILDVNIATSKPDVLKKIVVVHGSRSDLLNVNKTIADFFAATHEFNLPVQDTQANISESTRRRLIKIFGPIKVFRPWVVIPKNISEDYMHTPTLSSCYHKCPTKCPDTYAPVCGSPGKRAREPSLMFQNHCFMDVAQCKMYWEDKSDTAQSSAYTEASFVFCLGEELNGLYRFLPLIRTLQHMGRMKKKGTFKYKFKNMRFFNSFMNRQPKLMG